MRSILYYIIILTGLPFIVKGQPAAENKLFTLLPAAQTGLDFRNDIVEDENMFFYKYEYLYNGGGVSVGDINNDGLQDLYFSATQGPNRLYLNLGNMKFRDISNSAGVSGGGGIKTGVNMIDINKDGLVDIVVCKSGPGDAKSREKLVYINNGNLTFTDKAQELGLNDASFTTQSYFLDYDKDGDMDVLFVNQPGSFANAMIIPAKMVNGKRVYAEDTTQTFVSNRLYRNNNGKFTDVTKKAGLISNAFGLSAIIHDFNNDGWPDIYVANDFNKPDCIYINDQKGGFRDRMTDYFHHVSLSSMGSDMNDINNDGLDDLVVVDMAIEDPVRQKQLFVQNLNYDKFQLLLEFNLFYQYPRNMLQLNNGDGSFSDIAYFSGIAQTDWSWAPLIADYDNDGWKDLFVTNGYMRDVTDWDYKVFVLDSIKNMIARKQPVNLNEWFKLIPSVPIKNYLYRNNRKLGFQNMSDEWCDQSLSFSNSAVYVDLDNDGDLDLITNNINFPPFLYRNNSREMNGGNYLRFRFMDAPGTKRELYGTLVTMLDAGGNKQINRFDPQRGYMGTNEHYVHFGIGEASTVPYITIVFPSGKESMLRNVTANQILTIYESEAPSVLDGPPIEWIQFQKLNVPGFNFVHKENDFIDFKREPLIPYKCSRKGPYYTIGDVNGDKLDDIFIGGAAGQEGKLMLQSANATFVEKRSVVFTADKSFEDNGVLFFDADGDRDLDLYVVSGGAEFEERSAKYQDRLYINDGKGNFKKTINALPKEGSNGTYVLALDFDEDGDQDLFIGGGVMPGRFPQHDRNLLLQNSKGAFTDVTSSMAPDLDASGIVNYAALSDLDKDGKNELIIAGEWMAPLILKWESGKFRKQQASVQINNQTIGLDQLTGWWNVIKASDVDKDGDMDLLLGNRGLNSKITASIEEPCTIYAKDFDSNGSYDAVLGFYIWGKLYPMYHRDQLVDQMPFMRKRFLRYRHYAGTTMDQVFTQAQKKDMDVYKTGVFESGILYNDGNNSFRFVPFHEKAQLSNINDLIVEDFDKNGSTDIIVVGNSNDPDVSTGNYDATAVLFMRGDPLPKFSPVSNRLSGLKLKGEVRKVISSNGRLIFLKNNAPAEVYKLN